MLAGGPGDNEDAAIVSFPAGKALVQTVDFFTPMVNDPYRFGRIAAANALSDVYAMGGEPWAAMNIVCFPAKKLPMEVLTEILRGGADAVAEAGAIPSGGHSVEDDEIKYGLSVSGLVDPGRFASNRGVEPGDELILTKPIGTGVLATAVKGEMPGFEEIEELIFRTCGRLNKAGGAVIRELGVTGATDITGFGLGGHLLELAGASGVRIELRMHDVPLLPGALDMASMGMLPAGSICNRNHYLPHAEAADGLDPIRLDLMFDAQTSGGLLLAVKPGQLDQAMSMLEDAGDQPAHVGTAHAREQGRPALFIV
ncbi:selenide, water dikinase [Pseudodesulfovibrio portus]|uniref:Selenide, water dikinase n=1 Tax=Pseudodesulfovibrio portus TaxID=231439 RepID=A0ABM8ASW4_9BACT|nr:selenide, water dikinase [Pseudodesulfovibrio portus]